MFEDHRYIINPNGSSVSGLTFNFRPQTLIFFFIKEFLSLYTK